MPEGEYYPNIDMVKTGVRLKKLIEQKGCTVREVQDLLNLSCPQPVYRWFKGQILPSVDHLYTLSRFLGVHMEDLISPDCASHREPVCPCSAEGNMQVMTGKHAMAGKHVMTGKHVTTKKHVVTEKHVTTEEHAMAETHAIVNEYTAAKTCTSEKAHIAAKIDVTAKVCTTAQMCTMRRRRLYLLSYGMFSGRREGRAPAAPPFGAGEPADFGFPEIPG